jgi:hypothetical protein
MAGEKSLHTSFVAKKYAKDFPKNVGNNEPGHFAGNIECDIFEFMELRHGYL